LLAPSLEEMIPDDHICFLVESIIETMDFSLFDIRYSGSGHPAYHPRILLKILIMGILDRVRSSRRLAKNARENIVYMYLSEKVTPDFRTISDFRKDNGDIVKEAFKHTVTFAREEGLLDVSHLSTDGTKLRANASNRRVLSGEEIEFLLRFVDEELEQWAREDEIEDREYGELRGIDQLPKSSKKTLQKAAKYYIKKMKEMGGRFKDGVKEGLERAHKEVEEGNVKQVSTTDPDSRFMKNKKGRIELSYNCQVTTEKRGFIVANDIIQGANDTDQLRPQVKQTKENLGGLADKGEWSFDSAYFESGNIKFLSNEGIDGYIPDRDEKKRGNPFDKRHFRNDAQEDCYICPVGKRVSFLREVFDREKQKAVRVYRGEECIGCKERWRCTGRKDGIRHIKAYPEEAELNAMRVKMRTSEAKERYRIRKQSVEVVIGDIKENKGVRVFLTRGLETVKSEFNLICGACNIKRIWGLLLEGRQKKKTSSTELTQQKLDILYTRQFAYLIS
jgi:transposase